MTHEFLLMIDYINLRDSFQSFHKNSSIPRIRYVVENLYRSQYLKTIRRNNSLQFFISLLAQF